MAIFGYFIGGPSDLTKMTLPEPYKVIKIPVLQPISVAMPAGAPTHVQTGVVSVYESIGGFKDNQGNTNMVLGFIGQEVAAPVPNPEAANDSELVLPS